MVSFPRYERYKDSGVEWLGQIPEHWETLRTKNIFRLITEAAPKNNDEELLSVYSDIGVKPRRELEERGNKASTTDGYWIVKKGDVIVNKLLAWMGAIGISDYDGVTSPAYDVLRAYKPIDSKYYHYLFRSPICLSKLKQHSRGIMEMRLRLYFDEFGRIRLPYPPFEIQKRIVEFLDRKCGEIEDAIAHKKRLIELLEEQKTILINQAVTKGLDPNAPMKDSGIEWIGEIPTHWEVKKLKRISPCITVGIVITPSKYYVEEGVICLRSLNIKPNKILVKDSVYISERSNKYLSKSKIFAGDIVCVRTGQPGVSAVVDRRFDGANCIDLIIIRKPKNDLPKFVSLAMNSEVCRSQYLTGASGAIQQHFNIEMAQNLVIAIPPLPEQIKIYNHISKIQKNTMDLMNFIKREIDLMNELKQILIAEAVTGKIKI